ncbi:MAG: hypothetical protein KGJ07_01590 [Patescibacteria group bacterium]|nr:hypothetical protein [Patescibacteria group bacterium]
MARKVICDKCYKEMSVEEAGEPLLLPFFEEEKTFPIKGISEPSLPPMRLVLRKVDLCMYDKKELAHWLSVDPRQKGEDKID